MKFLGEPIFATPPQVCNVLTADCSKHGFGIEKERANYIFDAIHEHGSTCRDLEAGTVDYARYMAGPDIELTTHVEVLYTGYMLLANSQALQEWEEEASGKRALNGLMQDVNAILDRKHGTNGPVQE